MRGKWVLWAALALTAVLAVGFLFALGVIGPQKATPTPQRASTATAVVEASPTSPATNTPSSTPTPELGTSNLYVEYIIDASDSMTETLSDGSVKLAVAKDLLREHIAAFKPETNIGLRAYGHRVPYQQEAESCQDIELVAAPKAGQLESIATWLANFQALGMTPLAASLQQAVNDFIFDPARINSVVVLSDGLETCGGDPCRLVESLKARGINFTVHVIGLNVDNQAREQLSCVAKSGGGQYFDARTAQDVGKVLSVVESSLTKEEIIVPYGVETPTPLPRPTSTAVPSPTAHSPYLGRIVFLSHRDTQPTVNRNWPPYVDLYVMDSDGGNQTRLTRESSAGNWFGNIGVSPASDAILVGYFSGGLLSVSLENPEELVRLPITGEFASSAAWSPDGMQIAYTSWIGGGGQVIVASADGSDAEQLTSGSKSRLFVEWSPDGKHLAYTQDYSLWLMNPDGTDQRQLLAGQDVRNIAWSPDGRLIAFEAGNVWPKDPNAPSNQDIWLVRADGSGLRNLTNSAGIGDRHPSWSLDGSEIVFHSGSSLNGQERGQVFRMSVETGHIMQLTSEGYNGSPFWVR